MTWTDRPSAEEWEARGELVRAGGHEIFVLDLPAAGAERAEPVLVLHGFPTSSFDFAAVAGALATNRRVVFVDMLGHGLSAKPDVSYTMALQADAVMAAVAALGIERLALVTHDMGDTVGGELLARTAEGRWPVEVTRRVVTNGSIYIDMAQLTGGQLLLLSLPDEPIDAASAPGEHALAASLAATLAPANGDTDMHQHARLVVRGEGNRMLARTIRYIEERRANERRFTGAIETHPSPLGIVWGPEDPIAVAPMAERLCAARPDAELRWVEGAGHYPQVEDPAAWSAAVASFLDDAG